MSSKSRIGLVTWVLWSLGVIGPVAQARPPASDGEWNNPTDIELVARSFKSWTDAVIAKDRATVEGFHDDGFRAGVGDRIFTKAQHVDLEMLVGNLEMNLLKIQQTRRVGGMLLVWSRHFIRVNSLPEIPSLGLLGDWGDEKAAKRGFAQDEFSVWRREGKHIKCLSFVAARVREDQTASQQ